MKRDKTAYKSLYHDKNKRLKAALTSEMHFLILCDVVNEMSRMKIFSIHLFYLISSHMLLILLTALDSIYFKSVANIHHEEHKMITRVEKIIEAQ